MIQRLELPAPAKVNLGLEILRRRDDGFHDLNTVFATLDFGDTIALSSRSDHAITCQVVGADLPADDANLAVRAAKRLRELVGESAGLGMTIEKRIPMGAGLGGGSSDAAAVLMGASRIWGVEPPLPLVEQLALELGSDVPFFLRGGVARAGGRGEQLESLALRLPWTVLLINPGIHIATPAAFAAVGRQGERPASDLATALAAGIEDPSILRGSLVNDFEAAVFERHPELEALKRDLYEAGAIFALMSGSGATIFGLFEAHEAAERARARFAGHWSVVTRFRAYSSASIDSIIERSE